LSRFTLPNFSAGGDWRRPAEKETDFVGHTAWHSPQAKQSGTALSRFNIAPITVDGQARSQAPQAMQVE
jgi:hypothetical protein